MPTSAPERCSSTCTPRKRSSFSFSETRWIGVCERRVPIVAAETIASRPAHARVRVPAAFHDRDQDLARVFVKEVLFVRETNRQAIYDFVDGLIGRTAVLVEEASERGELVDDVPAQLVAENCFAAYLLRLQKWLGLREELASVDHTERLRDSFEVQLRGLAPKQPRPAARSSRRKRS